MNFNKNVNKNLPGTEKILSSGYNSFDLSIKKVDDENACIMHINEGVGISESEICLPPKSFWGMYSALQEIAKQIPNPFGDLNSSKIADAMLEKGAVKQLNADADLTVAIQPNPNTGENEINFTFVHPVSLKPIFAWQLNFEKMEDIYQMALPYFRKQVIPEFSKESKELGQVALSSGGFLKLSSTKEMDLDTWKSDPNNLFKITYEDLSKENSFQVELDTAEFCQLCVIQKDIMSFLRKLYETAETQSEGGL